MPRGRPLAPLTLTDEQQDQLNGIAQSATLPYQPVAKFADPAWPRRGRVSYTERHGDGQETGGAPGVADAGGHGGPSDERWASFTSSG